MNDEQREVAKQGAWSESLATLNPDQNLSEYDRELWSDGFDAGYAAASLDWRTIQSALDLPKEGDRYLVALWNTKTNKPQYDLRKFENGYFIGAEYSHLQVIAWMPIPTYSREAK